MSQSSQDIKKKRDQKAQDKKDSTKSGPKGGTVLKQAITNQEKDRLFAALEKEFNFEKAIENGDIWLQI